MPFITKINFQDNRQHRLPTRETHDLSGTTVFGLPFSAMTAGPDPTDSGTTGSIINVVSTFSGNTGTTVFTFGNPAMNIAQGAFSAITSANSADTQDSGNIFVGNTSQVVDGNLSYLDYTGTSFEFEVTAITETSPGIFTGSGISDDVFWLSAGTLDFTGRTIWSDVIGIHRTEKIIISNGATAGYVLTSDSEGMGIWAPSSGVSADTNTFVTGSSIDCPSNTIRLTRNDAVNIDTDITCLLSGFSSGTTFWVTGDSGTQSFKSIYGTGLSVTYDYSMVAGGRDNSLGGLDVGSDSAIIAGSGNTMVNTGGYQYRNIIAGGQGNSMTGRVKDGAILGGYQNSMIDFGSFIGAGRDNSISAEWSAILAGSGNTISSNGKHGVVLGGEFNDVNHQGAVAHGLSSHASGRYSYAGGTQCSATTTSAHAEGGGTLASGSESHAEGSSTIAGGGGSHAEGNSTIASGSYSHSQNYYTVASGIASHAGGWGNLSNKIIASGIGSFNHSSWDSISSMSGAVGDFSAILGGEVHGVGDGSRNSAIIAGSGNTINAGVINTVIIGGQNITATTNDMVYVPDLVIDGLTSTDPIATDANGKIVAGASDRRLKQNINDLTGGLEKIQNLRGVSYEWTEESNMGEGVHYGLIAQEVREVIPDMVRLRSKGDGMLTLNYNEVVPWLIEAVKEISSDEYVNTRLETQTIVAEDNNIELNFGGTHATANGGGISVKSGVREDADSFIKIDETGRWIIGPALTTAQLTLPEYTPESYRDEIGSSGDVVWDDRYLYIKTNYGWRRTGLETF